MAMSQLASNEARRVWACAVEDSYVAEQCAYMCAVAAAEFLLWDGCHSVTADLRALDVVLWDGSPAVACTVLVLTFGRTAGAPTSMTSLKKLLRKGFRALVDAPHAFVCVHGVAAAVSAPAFEFLRTKAGLHESLHCAAVMRACLKP